VRASVYFTRFLDEGGAVGGGGIGTLLSLLVPHLASLGHEVTVYQGARRPFRARFGEAAVVGIPLLPGPGRPNEYVVRRYREAAAREAGPGPRLEIFAADFFSARNRNPLAICVQNGIAWDADIRLLTPRAVHQGPVGERIFRWRCQLRGLRRFETCRNRVAVDLHFWNWYRSFRGPSPGGRVFYNPNPAPEAAWDARRERPDPGRPLRLIFARRLVPEKGTRLFAGVLRELLRERPKLEATIAGAGPDEGLLREAFAGEGRVSFTRYPPGRALEVHAEHDVAVVPSLCGEATCLGVVEAQAAGCAVVATQLGGTITQVLDGFNGRLVPPEAGALLAALRGLLDDPGERLRMQRAGWESSQRTFPLRAWRERWAAILDEVVAGGGGGR